MKTQAIFYILFSFLLATFSPGQTVAPEPPKKKREAKVDAAKLIGKWVMVKVGGEDQEMADEGEAMTLILREDKTFKIMRVIPDEGKIEVEGKYKLKKRKLILKIPDEEPTTPRISFRGENLVLGKESWAEFKKVKPEGKKKAREPEEPAAE